MLIEFANDLEYQLTESILPDKTQKGWKQSWANRTEKTKNVH